MSTILAIHGIDTPYGSQWPAEWSDALGMPVTPLRWDSRSKWGDVGRIAMSPDYRRSQVSALLQQVIDRIDDPQMMVLAHSQGSVWMGRVLRAMAATSVWGERIASLPVVFLGSPLHHPVYGGMLNTIGLGGPYPTNPLSIYNNGDPVCASRILGTREPPELDSVRIAIAGDGGHAEHMQYLEHPYTLSVVCDALTYGRFWDKR